MLKNKIMSVVAAGLLLGSMVANAIPVAGTSSGVFQNPVGPGGMVTTGAGTNSFTWGTGVDSLSSSLRFNGGAFSAADGASFTVGTITYFNGTILGGTQADSVNLAIGINFTDPSGINQSFAYMLNLINTPNTADPAASADIVQFPAVLPTAFFTVGGNSYTIGLEVGAVDGAGFSTQNTFSVLEQGRATATLRGRVARVPEPATLGLLGLGLVGVGFLRRKRAA